MRRTDDDGLAIPFIIGIKRVYLVKICIEDGIEKLFQVEESTVKSLALNTLNLRGEFLV